MHKIKTSILLSLVLFSTTLLADGRDEFKVITERSMKLANSYFLKSYSIGSAVWDRAAYHTGNMRAWETFGIQEYYDRSVAWSETNAWQRGPEGISHADAHCCGQTYIELYNIDPQAIRTNNITETFDYVLSSTDYVDDWWWIDAIYMAAPTLFKLGVLNNDTNYMEAAYNMYMNTKVTRGLFDESRGLWWRDGGYYGTDTYWGRGNGWVIAACARVLEVLPEDDTVYRPEFESMLRTMANALLPYQQSDGFWRSDIIDPDNYTNPETSCTAFFTYAIGYGINEGILVDSPGTNYTDVATNAWNGLVTTALHTDGKVGYVQGIGAQPAPASYNGDTDYGYGTFLLAGSEILRIIDSLPKEKSEIKALNVNFGRTNESGFQTPDLTSSPYWLTPDASMDGTPNTPPYNGVYVTTSNRWNDLVTDEDAFPAGSSSLIYSDGTPAIGISVDFTGSGKCENRGDSCSKMVLFGYLQANQTTFGDEVNITGLKNSSERHTYDLYLYCFEYAYTGYFERQTQFRVNGTTYDLMSSGEEFIRGIEFTDDNYVLIENVAVTNGQLNIEWRDATTAADGGGPFNGFQLISTTLPSQSTLITIR